MDERKKTKTKTKLDLLIVSLIERGFTLRFMYLLHAILLFCQYGPWLSFAFCTFALLDNRNVQRFMFCCFFFLIRNCLLFIQTSWFDFYKLHVSLDFIIQFDSFRLISLCRLICSIYAYDLILVSVFLFLCFWFFFFCFLFSFSTEAEIINSHWCYCNYCSFWSTIKNLNFHKMTPTPEGMWVPKLYDFGFFFSLDIFR